MNIHNFIFYLFCLAASCSDDNSESINISNKADSPTKALDNGFQSVRINGTILDFCKCGWFDNDPFRCIDVVYIQTDGTPDMKARLMRFLDRRDLDIMHPLRQIGRRIAFNINKEAVDSSASRVSYVTDMVNIEFYPFVADDVYLKRYTRKVCNPGQADEKECKRTLTDSD